jgi:hypothetical protein
MSLFWLRRIFEVIHAWLHRLGLRLSWFLIVQEALQIVSQLRIYIHPIWLNSIRADKREIIEFFSFFLSLL